MKRENRSIAYSFEHGDESLPHIRDLVSDIPDPEKSRIVSYLKTHCVVACAGIIRDQVNPGQVIGYGNIFSDGTYFWNDEFCNYVDKYNIPVPKEFRDHILENDTARMKRHEQLELVDSVEIQNNPCLGYRYHTRIYQNGLIRYRNAEDCADGAVMYIKPGDARYIIHPMMEELFCYDADEHGTAGIDGYHWKIIFYEKDKAVEEIEGWPGENRWRYDEVRKIIEFAEQFVGREMGSAEMNFYS